MFNASNWETTRKKGFFRFILVNGLLLFGFPSALLTALTRFYITSTSSPGSWHEFLSNGAWIGYIGQAMFSGLLFGSIIWLASNRSYNSLKKSDSEVDEVK